MSQGLVERQNLEDIADAIRSKNGSSDTYTPAEMAQAISGIHTADEVVLMQKTVNANGQYNASDDSADGYSGVRVNVPNTYSASDEGKVVSNGDLVAQTSKNINTNGTHDTTANNSVVVDVPNSYAAADEGKVVSGGALVGQTSRNVTMNGTYDTTENNQVVVNVSGGGGGSTNILHGTTDPTSQDGSDGSIYIVHKEVGVVLNLLENYQNIDLWTKNKAAFPTHIVQYADGVSRLTHTGGDGYERIFVPVDVEANTDYTFVLQFYSETNVPTGYEGANLAISVSQDDQTNTGSSGAYNNLGKKDLSRTATNDFSEYYINFNSGAYTRIYPIIDFNIQDGYQNIFNFKNVFLVKGIYTSIPISGIIEKVKLRKNNVWSDLIGSSITDVNLG